MKILEINPKAKALIFDLDGTLADTMPVHFIAYRIILEEFGIEFTPQLFATLAGIPAIETISKLNETSHLILHRTGKQEIRGGITVIVKGEGVRVIDQDGKSYIDLESGVTRPVHVGYGRSDLARAAYDQLVKLAYFSPMSYANAPAMQLADELAKITPSGINRFLFECDGSEAVESAMKLARHSVSSAIGSAEFTPVAVGKMSQAEMRPQDPRFEKSNGGIFI